jgi:hypothetical protein
MTNAIWRFYIDSRNRWRWERLSMVKDVVSRSIKSHEGYDQCLADAQQCGYVFQPAQGKVPSTLRSLSRRI